MQCFQLRKEGVCFRSVVQCAEYFFATTGKVTVNAADIGTC